MNRRWWLRGALGLAVLAGAAAGTGWWQWRPGFRDGAWPDDVVPTLNALASAVLQGSLPAEAEANAKAIMAWRQRLQALLSGMPPTVQAEVSDLLALLRLGPGRVVLCGAADDWAGLATAELQSLLRSMRDSTLAPRQQAYHALRDLTHAAWYAGPETWPALGYPGPNPV